MKTRMCCIVCVLVLGISIAASTADAEGGCSIMYGSDWAFTFATPDHWMSLCGAERAVGAALALWPQGTTFADAPAIMYVSVNEKSGLTLEEFTADEQRRFRADAPQLTIHSERPMVAGGGHRALVYSLSGDPGGNHELVGYVEGPTAFFILVVSSRNAESLERSRSAYHALIKSFVPMTAKMGTPGPAH